jgi:lysophospholipase L1-like esterase
LGGVLFGGAGLAGVAVILLSPDRVARYLSSDGRLTATAEEWLWVYRGFAAAVAIILLGSGLAVVACRRALEPVLVRHAGLGRKLLTALVSLIVALALGELALRLVGSGDGASSGNTGAYADYHRGFHASIRDQMDARGFRGALRPTPEGAIRILVIGDSMIFGYGLANGSDTFPAQLEAQLSDRPGQPIAVLNAGRPGADTAEHLAIFEELVDVVDPTVVVLAYCINDAIDRPLKRAYFANRRWLPLISDNVGRWSELWRRSESAWMRASERLGWRRDWTDTIASLYAPSSERLVRHRRDIERFVTAVRARGLPLVVVVFPFFEHLEAYPLAEAHAVVDGIFAELDVPSFDLLEVFAGSDARPWQVAPHDHHPNAAAHARAAEAFAGFVRNLPVLPDESD